MEMDDLFTDGEAGEDIGAYLGLDLDLSGSLEALGSKLSDTRISAEESTDSLRTPEGGAGVSEILGQQEEEEERSAEELEADGTRRGEEEEALARERAAQRQLLAIEEMVYTERNYLRLLQLASVNIRNNLQKIQVAGGGMVEGRVRSS